MSAYEEAGKTFSEKMAAGRITFISGSYMIRI